MIVAVESTSSNISWEEVELLDRNGAIIMYDVLYQPLETFNNFIENETVVIGSERTVTLNGLEEFVSYTIFVRAYTSIGPGPYSIGVTFTTLEEGKQHLIYSFYILNHSKMIYSPITSSSKHHCY